MTILYQRKKETKSEISKADIDIFFPSVFKGFRINGEKINLKTFLARFYFWIITKGGAKIYYKKSADGRVIHTSYVIPRCFKFPFLSKKDFQIGPCRTHPDFRGQGIYPAVIDYIVNTCGESDTVFSMTVDSSNQSSIRGIEKAGFEKSGQVEKKGIFKIYHVSKTKEISV